MARMGTLVSDKAKVRQAEAWLLTGAYGVSRSEQAWLLSFAHGVSRNDHSR